MSEDNLKGYVTVPDAARQLGRSTEQVRRYLREGKLDGHRVGGHWFVREPAVLYRTRPQEDVAMDGGERQGVIPGSGPAAAGRAGVLARVSQRREIIRRRWERDGIVVDPAAVIRELREEGW